MPLTPHDEDLVLMPTRNGYFDDNVDVIEGMESFRLDPTIMYRPGLGADAAASDNWLQSLLKTGASAAQQYLAKKATDATTSAQTKEAKEAKAVAKATAAAAAQKQAALSAQAQMASGRKTPSWVTPVAIAGGVVVLAGLAYVFLRKKG